MGLQQTLLSEPISSLPLAPGVMVPGETLVREAVAKMRETRQGCVVVVDDQGKPRGKFTEHHIPKLLANEPGFMNNPVSNYMRDSWACLRRGDPIATVIHKLQTYRQRFVVIVDDDGRAVGVTEQKGIMVYLSEQYAHLVKVQQMAGKLAIETREGA